MERARHGKDRRRTTGPAGGAGLRDGVAGGEPEPISSGDSVAGQPDPHPGEVDEGAQGPNAIPDDPTGEHPHKPHKPEVSSAPTPSGC